MALAAVAASCGGGTPAGPDNPTPPSGPGSSGGACRNYATAYSYVTTAPGVVATTTARCSFDASARTLTCDFSQTSNLMTCSVDFRWRDTYNSVADFVEEPRVLGRFLLTSRAQEHTPTPTSCPGATVPGTTTYTYDNQRRLVQSVAVNITGASSTTTYSYTEWDSQARPTAGTVSIGGGPSFPVVVTYNEGDRTVTISAGGSASISAITYDSDGNIVRFRGESSGFVTESVYDITSRTPVCG